MQCTDHPRHSRSTVHPYDRSLFVALELSKSIVSANFGARGGECLRLERMTPPQTNLGLSH